MNDKNTLLFLHQEGVLLVVRLEAITAILPANNGKFKSKVYFCEGELKWAALDETTDQICEMLRKAGK